jgi:hypothetical protein
MPSNAAGVAAALLEALAGTTGAELVSADLLQEFLVAVDDPDATLHLRLGRKAFASFAHRLEKNDRCSRSCWSMIHHLSWVE